jgi:lipoprotein-anchoring transpeptidase ErfK/SrfK
MKTVILFSMVIFGLGACLSVTEPVSAAGPSLVIVRWGDTLARIAARYDTTVQELVRVNALPNANFIFAGQRLMIPGSTPQSLPATTNVYTVQAGDTLFSIVQRTGTTVDAVMRSNGLINPDFIYVGQRLSLKAATPIVDEPAPAPKSAVTNPASAGKWIAVNLTTQSIAAYEGTRVVRSALVSTGVARTPTPVGQYEIYVKYKSQTMSGGSKASNDYYYLPNVPNVMYFYEAYALHGTYWHRNFGQPMSRGCVNLSLADAEWFFNWAEIGTPVVTRN